PLILGKKGIEKVIELKLNDKEKEQLETSRKHVKEVMDVLEKLGK
ncbi:MAG: malate dehydrogenase, partial [Flammeovirgaceae bacterium]|nr:malate dehydrogenase [Flammeovirgaceae bacterium]